MIRYSKHLHLPWRRLKKYLLFYLGLVLTTIALSALGYRILGPLFAFVILLGLGWIIFTVLFFWDGCRAPRRAAAIWRRSNSDDRLRAHGICPIHGNRAIESVERKLFPDHEESPMVPSPYCTACRQFVVQLVPPDTLTASMPGSS